MTSSIRISDPETETNDHGRPPVGFLGTRLQPNIQLEVRYNWADIGVSTDLFTTTQQLTYIENNLRHVLYGEVSKASLAGEGTNKKNSETMFFHAQEVQSIVDCHFLALGWTSYSRFALQCIPRKIGKSKL